MNDGFERRDANGTAVYRCRALTETGLVRHAFSTRLGGVSAGGDLNLGMHTKDDPAKLRENYRIFCGAAGVDASHLVLAQQTHGDRIRIVTRADCGKGLDRPPDGLEETDGLVTAEKGVALATFYADCTPLLFFDPVERVIASVHSGWRGTLARIGRKAARTMARSFGCRPENLTVAIGPSIRSCHFEVGEDVRELFAREFGRELRPFLREENGRTYIDTQGLNASQLREEGVPESRIWQSELCTVCGTDRFFSHRGDRERPGRMCAVIELTEESSR